MVDFDLNLVRTFVLLYETGSVTSTAEALHLSQPTVSYSLGKLRRRFDDELFRRSPAGMVPTVSAERLYPPLRKALADIDGAVSRRAAFDPATTPARFTIALSDIGETTLLPQLVTAARQEAPGVTFAVRALDVTDAEDLLIRGELDAFVATPVISSPKLTRIPLFKSAYRAMAAADHPRLRRSRVSLEELGREQHALVLGPTGHRGPPVALATHGLLDRVALEVTRFSILPHLLEESDLIAIAPADAAEIFARSHRIRVLELPFEIEPVEVAAYARHEHSRSPEQQWLVDFLVRVLARPRPE
ncbi:MAG: LysR substrate-binding domain-containing protein [Nocardioides sp.]|uniref:LysR substrate-binding domain-containing protein n=1 Tax=Nocardioides sp. TaxID=35761 RepID=UPI003D6C3B1B